MNSLEDILRTHHEDSAITDEDKESNLDDSTEEFEVLGKKEEGGWSVPENVMRFYLKAADISLSQEILKDLKDQYKTPEDRSKNFEPPRFPQWLWNNVQQNKIDMEKLKAIYKVQSNLYLAIKPLLECLANTSDEDNRRRLIESIQLICTSNLQLNRFRRTNLSFHLKTEVYKQIASTPVTHNSLFGEDEDLSGAADKAVKEQTVMDKMLKKRTPVKRLSQAKDGQESGSRFFRGKKAGFRGGTTFRTSGSRKGRGNGKYSRGRGGRGRGGSRFGHFSEEY